MNVHYLLRLVCLCLASFFVVNGMLGLILSAASRHITTMAGKMRARSAADFLFLIRLLPVALGVAAVLALCVPSYLLLEPDATSERLGVACLLMAALGAFVWLAAIVRASRAVSASVRCNKSWQQAGAKKTGNLIVASDAPLLALTGVFQPRLILSQGVVEALSPDQLDVALLHENAHRTSRDNLKRLLLLLAPHPLPFVLAFAALEQSWIKFREWAADDEAVLDDPHRALSLAAALLRVARMGSTPRLSCLHTSLVAPDHNLSERVERLLHVEAAPRETLTLTRVYAPAAISLLATTMAILLSWPATLLSVHRLLEQFLR
jgi:beta-lactamase regulating signal transducer with metallopeptidase domain